MSKYLVSISIYYLLLRSSARLFHGVVLVFCSLCQVSIYFAEYRVNKPQQAIISDHSHMTTIDQVKTKQP